MHNGTSFSVTVIVVITIFSGAPLRGAPQGKTYHVLSIGRNRRISFVLRVSGEKRSIDRMRNEQVITMVLTARKRHFHHPYRPFFPARRFAARHVNVSLHFFRRAAARRAADRYVLTEIVPARGSRVSGGPAES